MVVEIAPGPASMGMASGVMATSVFSTPALVSSRVSIMREHLPELKIRVVNVVDL
ncbi:MAG: hypothetical protein ABSF34_17475, partial [Verrucomicrobiota bacterium]